MLIKHFPAFPGLWKLLQIKSRFNFFPFGKSIPFSFPWHWGFDQVISHAENKLSLIYPELFGIIWLPFVTQQLSGDGIRGAFPRSQKIWVTLPRLPKVSPRSRNHGALPLPHPCLGFGNYRWKSGAFSKQTFGKVGFVEWVMGLEFSCVMGGGGDQVFQRNLLWSLGCSWKNPTFCGFLGYCMCFPKPIPTWLWILPGMGQLHLLWTSYLSPSQGRIYSQYPI